MDSEEPRACSNFQMDLVGAFNTCKNCHLPKIKHIISNDPPKSNASNAFKDKINKFSDQKAPPVQDKTPHEFQRKRSSLNPVFDSKSKRSFEMEEEEEKKAPPKPPSPKPEPPKKKEQIKEEKNQLPNKNAPQKNPPQPQKLENKGSRLHEDEDNDEPQACDNFQMDLTGAFGSCKNCHLPKIKHTISDKPRPAQINKQPSIPVQNKQPIKVPEPKKEIEKEVKKHEEPIKEVKKVEKEVKEEKKVEKESPKLPAHQKQSEKEDDEDKACDNFQVDLTGAFGSCKNCHKPKIKHANNNPPVPGRVSIPMKQLGGSKTVGNLSNQEKAPVNEIKKAEKIENNNSNDKKESQGGGGVLSIKERMAMLNKKPEVEKKNEALEEIRKSGSTSVKNLATFLKDSGAGPLFGKPAPPKFEDSIKEPGEGENGEKPPEEKINVEVKEPDHVLLEKPAMPSKKPRGSKNFEVEDRKSNIHMEKKAKPIEPKAQSLFAPDQNEDEKPKNQDKSEETIKRGKPSPKPELENEETIKRGKPTPKPELEKEETIKRGKPKFENDAKEREVIKSDRFEDESEEEETVKRNVGKPTIEKPSEKKKTLFGDDEEKSPSPANIPVPAAKKKVLFDDSDEDEEEEEDSDEDDRKRKMEMKAKLAQKHSNELQKKLNN